MDDDRQQQAHRVGQDVALAPERHLAGKQKAVVTTAIAREMAAVTAQPTPGLKGTLR